MIVRFLTFVCLGLLTACAPLPPEQTLRTDFTAIGLEGARAKQRPVAIENVQLFYKSGPPGFEVSGDIVSVKEGFRHEIVGELRVRSDIAPSSSSRREHPRVDCQFTDGRPVQRHVVQALKAAAAQRGATAVVFAYSNVSQQTTQAECESALEGNHFGGGWAVILDAASAAPANE